MLALVPFAFVLLQSLSTPPGSQTLDCRTSDASMMLPEAPQQQTLFGESYCTTLNRLTPLRVGGTLPPPVKIKDVRPLYPEDAQDARIQGVVIVEAIVDAEGRVANARIVRSIPLFNESALDAVSKWQYRPVLVNGDPVPFITTVTVNYAMQ